ncbi:MAG: flavodoxin family protein [Acidobacteria bacterium]|nr:flavodoxin family protein [Acidobacteriota bacterium]
MRRILLALVFSLVAVAQQPPARILVAYHSGTGNTEKLAVSIRDGAAAVQGVDVTLRKAAEFKYDEITGYDGVVLGTPVHWSGVSVEAKRFLDGIGGALWKAKTNGDGRTAGVFCTAGHPSMGKDTVRLSVLSAFLTMRFVVVGGVESEGFGTLGPEATTGPADPGISEKEMAEARRFGERFAQVTRSLRQARGARP